MATDQKKIWIDGQPIEVTEEVYEVYTKGDRKMRYFACDLKTERILLGEDGQVKQVIPSREDSLDRLMEDCAMQFPDIQESVESTVLRKMAIERLYQALDTLPEKERKLIDALFFEGLTERDAARIFGTSQPAIHKQKNRILRKLKFFLES